MERVLRDTRAKVFATFYGEEGSAADVTTPKVTVVRDSDGATVVNDQAATDEATTGLVSFTLTSANVPDVDLLRAAWSGTLSGTTKATTEIEVVGGHLCSLEAIKEALTVRGGTDPGLPKLREAREWAERLIEDLCNVAFRPRYAREVFDGNGTTDLFLRPRAHVIRSVKINGTALSGGELAGVGVYEGLGVAYRESGWPVGRRNIEVVYEHGHRSTPEPVRRVAAKAGRSYLVANPSSFDDRATRVETEEAAYSLVTPGVRGARTAIPELNQVIEDYGYPIVGR